MYSQNQVATNEFDEEVLLATVCGISQLASGSLIIGDQSEVRSFSGDVPRTLCYYSSVLPRNQMQGETMHGNLRRLKDASSDLSQLFRSG